MSSSIAAKLLTLAPTLKLAAKKIRENVMPPWRRQVGQAVKLVGG